MARNIRRAGIAAALMLALTAPSASAETFKTTFGPGRENVFNWEGMATGAPTTPFVTNGCFDLDPAFRCDLIVFKTETAGELEASITIDGPVASEPTGNFGIPDLDIALYVSNSTGVHPDDAEPVATGSTTEATETIKTAVKPGYYVLEVEPFQGQNVTYKGTSKGTGFIAPEPAPAAPATPATPAAPAAHSKKTGKRAACQKKAKKKFKKNKAKRTKALRACAKQPA
jgi:hypothetical protein